MGGVRGLNWGGRSPDENLTRPFFFAPTQFLEHPFARDQRFRRPFLLQLSFWSTPLSGIRDFDHLFLLQISFRSTPLSGTRYFHDIFLFQFSFWSTPFSFDQRFRRPFSKLFFHNRLYILREQWRLLNPAAPAVAGERRPLQGRFFNGPFSGAFFATCFFDGL